MVTRQQVPDSEKKAQRVLVKFRGTLAIAEVSVRTDGTNGSCPECGATEFVERAGWTECDCGFAYLSADVERLKSGNAFLGG